MIPQINLIHLKYFCDAVKYQSISGAAKANFVSQSAVSQAITKLEVNVGTAIAYHTRQKFLLTENGKILFEQAQHIFKAVSEIHSKIEKGIESPSTSLNFVSTKSLGMSYLAPDCQKESYGYLAKVYPNVQISYKLGNLNFIRQSIQNDEAEFGLVVYDQSFNHFNHRLLNKGLFQLYQHTQSTADQIDKGILVDFYSGMYVNELCKYYSQVVGRALNIQMELNGWEVVSRFTDINVGVGFFPDYVLSNNRYPHLKKFPLELPPFEYEICAIYNKGKKLSNAAAAFLDTFSFGEEIINKQNEE